MMNQICSPAGFIAIIPNAKAQRVMENDENPTKHTQLSN